MREGEGDSIREGEREETKENGKIGGKGETEYRPASSKGDGEIGKGWRGT